MNDEQEPRGEMIGHEPIAANSRGIWYALGGLTLLILAALVLVAGLMTFFMSRHAGEMTVRAPGPPSEPPPGVTELNPNQKVQLRRLRFREREVLTEYGWIDQQAGVARIPIERAMRILAGQTPPAAQTQGTGNETE
jgi:hypothetical protein